MVGWVVVPEPKLPFKEYFAFCYKRAENIHTYIKQFTKYIYIYIYIYIYEFIYIYINIYIYIYIYYIYIYISNNLLKTGNTEMAR